MRAINPSPDSEKTDEYKIFNRTLMHKGIQVSAVNAERIAHANGINEKQLIIRYSGLKIYCDKLTNKIIGWRKL